MKLVADFLRYKRKAILFIFAITVCFPVTAKVQTLAGLKAAYVYNIAKFTRWPEYSLGKNMRLFKLCLYGKGEVIEELKKLNGRPLSVHSMSIVDLEKESDFIQCHALYVSSSEKRRYRYVLSLVNVNSVLTISDDEKFLRQGGLVNLLEKQQKLRFEISRPLLSEIDLKMSSKLLKLALMSEGDR